MSRRVRIVIVVAALLGAACAKTATTAELDLGSGVQFVPEVVDFSKNVGMSPSVVVDNEGNPFVSYLGFEANLKPGEIPETRPVTAPPLPNVLFANIQDQYWNVGGVAVQPVASGVPKGDEELVDPENVDDNKIPYPWPFDATSATVDAQGGLHVVWSERNALQYAEDSSGQFSPQKVVSGAVRGPSVTVDGSGTPWISYFRGSRLEVASLRGGKWNVEPVDRVGPIAGENGAASRTAIAAGRDGPVVAYTDNVTPLLAVLGSDGWEVQPVERNGGGFGISLVLDAGGNPHVAYYTATGEVRHAHLSAGSGWSVDKLAEGAAQTGGGTIFGWATGIALDDKGVHYVTWYDLNSNSVALATNAEGEFKRIETSGTEGGNSPSVAVTPDGAKVFVAWYDGVNQNLQVGIYGETKGLAVAVVSPSPVATKAAPPSPTVACEPKGTTVKIVAPSGAATSGFASDCAAAPADTDFKLVFENQDANIHNVSVYTDPGAAQQLFTTGDPFPGPKTVTADVKAQKAGNYYFQCDVHPTTMTGAFIVK